MVGFVRGVPFFLPGCYFLCVELLQVTVYRIERFILQELSCRYTHLVSIELWAPTRGRTLVVTTTVYLVMLEISWTTGRMILKKRVIS